MKFNAIASATIIALSLAITACTTVPNNMPLIFGEDISVGISMGGSTTSQGAELTLGFKSKDVAIVPVVIAGSGTTPTLIQSNTSNTASDGKTTTTNDAYSVLGQFSTSANSAGQKVNLGKFFATGAAAVRLSDGFKQALSASTVTASGVAQ